MATQLQQSFQVGDSGDSFVKVTLNGASIHIRTGGMTMEKSEDGEWSVAEADFSADTLVELHEQLGTLRRILEGRKST